MSNTPPVAGPYSHSVNSMSRTMFLLMAALLPATLFGIYQFGWPALFIWLLAVASAVVAEAFCLHLAGKPQRPFLSDGSALVTGWLLAATLPPWAPWWIAVTGSVFAIVVGKHIFGGLGQNLFNPAMAARVMLLISFPLQMTTWVDPRPFLSAGAVDFVTALSITFGDGFQIDAMSSASLMGHVKTELDRSLPLGEIMAESYHPWSLVSGTMAGSLAETSALLILLGGIGLILLRVISWTIPLAMLATLALLAVGFNLLDPDRYAGPIFHLFSGATVLGAFFIATDPVTSPSTVRGQLLFGAGCGLLVFVIRTWAGYPEGMAFAVLLMNAVTPLIDHYIRPRIMGRTRRGDPLAYPPA